MNQKLPKIKLGLPSNQKQKNKVQVENFVVE